MNYYLGLDLGTTGMKAAVINEDGSIVSKAEVLSPMNADGEKREFDADEYVCTVFELIKKVTGPLGENKKNIRAIAQAHAAGNTVFLDLGMNPLLPCISWTDERCLGKDAELLPGFDFENVHDVVGWPYLGMFSLAHIAYVKKYESEIFDKAKKICMITEYLNYRLCGSMCLDKSTAVPFYMVDQKNGCYYKPYLEYFGIEEDRLPELVETGSILGSLTPYAQEKCGLSEDVKVIAGAFDHPCAARGAGVSNESTLLLSCGTSWTCEFLSRNRQEAVKQGLLTDAFDAKEGLWLCISSIAKFGQMIDDAIIKYVDSSENKFKVFNAEAEAFYKAKNFCFADILDKEKVKSQLIGKPVGYAAASIMAGACASLKKSLGNLERCGLKAQKVVMAGGPTKSPLWLLIMQDILGMKITVQDGEYSGAAGAALIAKNHRG